MASSALFLLGSFPRTLVSFVVHHFLAPWRITIQCPQAAWKVWRSCQDCTRWASIYQRRRVERYLRPSFWKGWGAQESSLLPEHCLWYAQHHRRSRGEAWSVKALTVTRIFWDGFEGARTYHPAVCGSLNGTPTSIQRRGQDSIRYGEVVQRI